MTSIRNDGNLLFKAKLLNSCFSGEKNQSQEMNNYLTHKYNKKRKKTYQMLNLEFKKWIYVILDLETTVPSDFIKCLYTDRWRIIDRSASEPTTKRGFHEVLYKQSP